MMYTVGLVSAATDIIGDAIPAHLGAYFAAIDAGRFDQAVDQFTDDCLYAVPRAGIETQPRVVTEGRDALRERLEARGHLPRTHVVLLCVADGDQCLVEGIVAEASNGAPVSTFVASATLSPTDGRIERYLAYACDGARDPIPADTPPEAPASVPAVLDAYFGALDTGRFEAAADCFSDSVLYSHPPYKHTHIDGNTRVEFRGRDELLTAFRARGRQSFGHEILTCIQRGSHAILEGFVRDLPDGGSGSFISSVSLDADGRISRYVSFYCEPSVATRRATRA